MALNEELRDFLLKKQHYIHKFENGTVADLVSHFNRAKAELAGPLGKIALLEQGGTGWTLQYRIDRLKGHLAEINHVLENATHGAIENLTNTLQEFALQEKATMEALLSTAYGNVGISLKRLPLEHVLGMVETPIGGANYAERLLHRYTQTIYEVQNELVQSMIAGEDMARAARRVAGVGKAVGADTVIGARLVKGSRIIARTEIMRVSNEVNKGIFDANRDVIKGLQFVATLDDRTCLACAVIDGKIFYYNKNPITANDSPPKHPYCRCVLAPVTKSWKELAAEHPPAREAPKGTRASFDGQVPATLRYGAWLKQMNSKDPEFVKNILGKRYDPWKQGIIEFKEMVKNNHILTLDELQEIIDRRLAKGITQLARTQPRAKGRPKGAARPHLLERGQVTDIADLGGGANETFAIYVKDPDTGMTMKGVFKPEWGEEKWLRGAIRPNARKFPYYQRDLATYEVDQELGIGLTPKTVVRKKVQHKRPFPDSEGRLSKDRTTWVIGEDTGSIMRFVDGSQEAMGHPVLKFTPEEYYKWSVLDFMVANTDRHLRNLMFKATTNRAYPVRAITIDHGLTFPKAFEGDPMGIKSLRVHVVPLWQSTYDSIQFAELDTFVRSSVKKDILDRLKKMDTKKYMRKYDMSLSEWKAFEARRVKMIELVEQDGVGKWYQTYHSDPP